MDKNKQKREKYHPLAVNKVAEMYGFSARYVRQILKGDRKGLMADNVKRDYKRLCNENRPSHRTSNRKYYKSINYARIN